MTRRFAAITFVLSLALTPIASADMMVDLVDINGIDSGWSVALADNIHTGIAVDAVTVDSVRIEVFKEFYHPPVGGRFAANTIRFVQRLSDAKTVGTIEITDEIVIKVFVEKNPDEARRRLPGYVGGIPVVVEEIGRIVAF